MQLTVGKGIQKYCSECGAVSADHWSVWVSSTLEIGISSLGAPTRLSAFFSACSRGFARLVAPVLPPLFRAAEFLHVVSRNDDLEQACTKRSRAVWQEARLRGIPMQQFFVFGIPTEFFEANIFGMMRIFYSLPIPPIYRAGTLWADDKHLLKQKFKEAGVAAPLSFSVSTLHQASAALKQLGTACVKPRTGSNGRHTFPHVSTSAELVKAFASAKKLCHWVAIEQHLEGNVGRATCVNGQMIGFLESKYPTVVGDGSSTVRELVERENKNKPVRVEDIEITPLHECYVERRGYTLDSVLEKGKMLPLVYWAGRLSGGRTWEHGTDIHPELKKEIERAARLTKLPVVGFDLIIQNPKESPQSQMWGIIEANSLPWIDLHLEPLYGTPVHVAKHLWDLWEQPHTQKAPAIAENF
ncbi:hypothetical protein A3F55_02465 [Candidatus Adlerbacteria bacterium RIFCSPHIGHO2_12_FULL_53_18]|uniref:ATP-grasp domain-containing protein n=1 Tax=Candidatus Adlerbacteria bacterium RIFCSPHIGHO2_12_FULL_53_18 TaxID=1797242 RepID=A0A1F4XSY0_9BACT|nr:MAG: hypothetical protein A3F55_02465 [Candidatus Adlerbacteria bacterium RIFCSPHIGHO2_12_FULL_53_18]